MKPAICTFMQIMLMQLLMTLQHLPISEWDPKYKNSRTLLGLLNKTYYNNYYIVQFHKAKVAFTFNDLAVIYTVITVVNSAVQMYFNPIDGNTFGLVNNPTV